MLLLTLSVVAVLLVVELVLDEVFTAPCNVGKWYAPPETPAPKHIPGGVFRGTTCALLLLLSLAATLLFSFFDCIVATGANKGFTRGLEASTAELAIDTKGLLILDTGSGAGIA